MTRRRFNRSERVALYVKANGRCEHCDTELPPGWHADHVIPYSQGGPTDVANGAALCPTCNLKKGTTMPLPENIELRPWQEQFIHALQNHPAGNRNFVLQAAPGAGKTMAALASFFWMRDRGLAEHLTIVVPSIAILNQWQQAAPRLGLQLQRVDNDLPRGRSGYDGIVLTYAQLAREPEAHRLALSHKTYLIIDEVHHAGDAAAYGTALREAFGDQHDTVTLPLRLLLTGTPWRTDGTPIPFVRYDANGIIERHFIYGYGDCVRDGVSRTIRFMAYDGEMRYVYCGDEYVENISDGLTETSRSLAMRTALEPNGNYLRGLLVEGVRELEILRLEVPHAGGLILARDISHAYEIADLMREITGRRPPVVASDETTDAQRMIDAFRDSDEPWIIAVAMISEGVDIPRLSVLVYATNKTTRLFFEQAVGRATRRGADEDHDAVVIMPADQRLLDHASNMQYEMVQALKDAHERREHEMALELLDDPQPRSIFQPLASSEAELANVIHDNDHLDTSKYVEIASQCKAQGIPERYAPNVLKVIDNVGVAIATRPAVSTRAPYVRERHEATVRRQLNQWVGHLAAKRAGTNPELIGSWKKSINTDIVAKWGVRKSMSLEDLQAATDWVMTELSGT